MDDFEAFLETLPGATPDSEITGRLLEQLAEHYFPGTHLETRTIMNACSRENTMFQRALKPHMKGKKRVLEIGCGSGDMTIPMANRFPGARYIAIDPTTAIVYAALKRDLHNLEKSKGEYMLSVRRHVPAEFCRHDHENHPFWFRRLDNLSLLPVNLFDLAEDADFERADLVFAAFVANNYCSMSRSGDLHMLIRGMKELTSADGEIVIIDGNFGEIRCIPDHVKISLMERYELRHRYLGKIKKTQHFMLWGKKHDPDYDFNREMTLLLHRP